MHTSFCYWIAALVLCVCLDLSLWVSLPFVIAGWFKESMDRNMRGFDDCLPTRVST